MIAMHCYKTTTDVDIGTSASRLNIEHWYIDLLVLQVPMLAVIVGVIQF